MPCVYHLYCRRASRPGRVRLTVTPVSKEAAGVLFSKLLRETQARAYILPAAPDDVTVPTDEL